MKSINSFASSLLNLEPMEQNSQNEEAEAVIEAKPFIQNQLDSMMSLDQISLLSSDSEHETDTNTKPTDNETKEAKKEDINTELNPVNTPAADTTAEQLQIRPSRALSTLTPNTIALSSLSELREVPKKEKTTRTRSRTIGSSAAPDLSLLPPAVPLLNKEIVAAQNGQLPLSLQRISIHEPNNDIIDAARRNKPSLPRSIATRSSSASSRPDAARKLKILSTEELREFVKKQQEERPSQAPHESSKSGFIRDLEQSGFTGLFHHPFLRLYFVLFLLDKKKFSLYVFINEAEEFSQAFSKATSHQKHQKSYRIVQKFLLENSPYWLQKYLPLTSDKDQILYEVLQSRLHALLKEPTEDMFDDLKYVAMEYLSTLCAPGVTYNESFFESAAYQALVCDLGKANTLTNTHVDKIINRFIDLPTNTIKAHASKIASLLDKYSLEWRSSPLAIPLLEEVALEAASHKKNQKMTSNISIENSNPETDNDNDKFKNGESSLSILAEGKQVDEHPFINYLSTYGKYCEKCFKAFKESTDSSQTAVRCEACHYICHKSCRINVKMRCVSTKQEANNQMNTDHSSFENCRALLEKYLGLTKELKVSQNLKAALGKIKEAKGEPASFTIRGKDKLKEKEKQSKDQVSGQILQLEKKIQFLFRDLEACKVDLALSLGSLLGTIPEDEIKAGVWGVPELDKSLQEFAAAVPESTLIKVFLPSTEDVLRPSRTRKTIAVSKDSLAKDLIQQLISKSKKVTPGFSWSSPDYALIFEDSVGNEVCLPDNVLPTVVQQVLGETTFYMKAKELIATPIKSTPTDDDIAKKLQKRKAVLMELVETEKGYTENIQLAIKFFYLPISNSGLVPRPTVNGLFGNLQEVVNLHTKISEQMKAKLNSDPELKEPFNDCILEKIPQMKTAYLSYCVNQNNSYRTLTKLKENNEFLKFLKECESRPQLSKLSLADILIQPMHRITRYPILLKRLFPLTPEDHPDYPVIKETIEQIEKVVAEVNEAVKKKETEYRIRYLQHCIEWNNQCEPLTLIHNNRKLIEEKSFTLIQPAGSKKANFEVLNILFSDMILLTAYSKKKDGKEEFLLLKPPIYLANAMLFTAPPQKLDDGIILQHLFKLVHVGKEAYTFQTISNTDKVSWLSQVESIAYVNSQFITQRQLMRRISLTTEEAEAAQISITQGIYFYRIFLIF